MSELPSRIEKHFRFSSDELLMMLATAFVAAFGLTLENGWGVFNLIKEQSAINYILNLILVLIIISISLLVHFSAQKIVSLKLGYISKYRHWTTGYVISTFICFITFTFIPLFFVGGMWPSVEKKLRMGRFRPGVMHSDVGTIAFAGPFSNIIFAMILGFFYAGTGNNILFSLIVANLLVAIYSLLPIPYFEPSTARPWNIYGGSSGLHLFIASRWVYVLVFSFVIFFSALVLIAKIFSLIVSLILAIFVAAIYYKEHEK